MGERSDTLDIEIINESIRFDLYGLSSQVDDQRYGDVGVPLMNKMWAIINNAGVSTTGINYWVYFADDRMFVGVELHRVAEATVPKSLEPSPIELARYAKHVHVGPYQELPQKWQALHAELSKRGETVLMPSLEVYGHSCEGADESQAETTILLSLKPTNT